jgi:predicted RND superfamily exporter protein
MTFPALLVGLVDFCRRNALPVLLAGLILAIFSGWYAKGHLGISTDTDEMFAASLPWRQRAEAFKKLFPQFQDLLVAVIDAFAGRTHRLSSRRRGFCSWRRINWSR